MIEKFDHAGFQCILGADDHEAIGLTEVFEDRRPMAEMVDRRTDIGANGLPYQRIGIVPELGPK